MKNNQYLFLITLTYFALGFVNIHFALLGLICMALPLFLLIKNNRKTWCQGYCPRACLYNTCGKLKGGPGKKTPLFFITGPMKWIMLGYFILSLAVIMKSTFSVASGSIEAMDSLRFLMLLPLPKIPQLFTFTSSPWILHLSYRFYSMMLTTTTLGLILAMLYKPRTWCTICPIATVSEGYLKSKKKISKITTH